jgi:eukaryotic-like serine/threonine-protein kinase
LVDTEGHSKLADFGLAVRTGRQGILAGTPSYMAPEQWAGASATPQTDIYAATATFFECLTGRPPYSAGGDRRLIRMQHESSPIPVDAVAESLHGLLRHGMAKDPSQRPRDAATFLRELETVAGDAYGADWAAEGRRKLARRVLLLAMLLPRPPQPPPSLPPTPSFAWTRLGRTTVKLAALLIVLAGVIVAHVALADQISIAPASHDASTLMAPSIIGPPTSSPSATPPSPSPSPSSSSSHMPHPKKSKPTHPSSPPPSPSSSPSASPTPPPVPTFGALAVSSDLNESTQVIEWTADARAIGSGKATLHVEFYPLSVTGAPLDTPSDSWTVAFTVTASGPLTWTDSAGVLKACGDGRQVITDASITVSGETVKTAQSAAVTCDP